MSQSCVFSSILPRCKADLFKEGLNYSNVLQTYLKVIFFRKYDLYLTSPKKCQICPLSMHNVKQFQNFMFGWQICCFFLEMSKIDCTFWKKYLYERIGCTVFFFLLTYLHKLMRKLLARHHNSIRSLKNNESWITSDENSAHTTFKSVSDSLSMKNRNK